MKSYLSGTLKISTAGINTWKKIELGSNSTSFFILFYRAGRDKECHYYPAIPGAGWPGKIHQLQHPGVGFYPSWGWSEERADLHPHERGW